jgi:UDP-3-O-acyl-N-acetylglucosamine deacetylase
VEGNKEKNKNERWMNKFSDKEWIQERLVEVMGDLLMIGIEFIGAYYIQVFIM